MWFLNHKNAAVELSLPVPAPLLSILLRRLLRNKSTILLLPMIWASTSDLVKAGP